MSHHDPHHHSPEHKHDYAKANAERFDKESKNQEMIKLGTEMAQLSAPYILKHYKFNKETTEVLDFAAGWGLVSKQIIPYAKTILGVDISQGMVDLYNETSSKEGLSGMKAVRAELKGEGGELNDQKFDVIICNMAYHHFEDVGKMTKILAGFLKPGGKLVVSDFRPGGGGVREEFADAVAHIHGMSEDVMRDAFTGAGLTDIIVEDAFEYTFFERALHIFFIVGSKA